MCVIGVHVASVFRSQSLLMNNPDTYLLRNEVERMSSDHMSLDVVCPL